MFRVGFPFVHTIQNFYRRNPASTTSLETIGNARRISIIPRSLRFTLEQFPSIDSLFSFIAKQFLCKCFKTKVRIFRKKHFISYHRMLRDNRKLFQYFIYKFRKLSEASCDEKSKQLSRATIDENRVEISQLGRARTCRIRLTRLAGSSTTRTEMPNYWEDPEATASSPIPIAPIRPSKRSRRSRPPREERDISTTLISPNFGEPSPSIDRFPTVNDVRR